jgi:hypothetical protein
LYAQPLSSGHRPKRAEDQIQRATQTYLWDLSLINTLGMKVGSEKVFGVGYNVLPIWKKRLDAKTLITTPNSDVIMPWATSTSAGAGWPAAISISTPAGKEGNWLATVQGKGYSVVFGLYGPTAAAIDKSRKPGDIERVP